MATLRYFSADGAPKLLPVHKPLIVIGRGSGNDVAVSGEGVLEHHAQIVFNGRDFQIEELDRDAEISINGKRKRRARLVNGDRIKLGSAELIFSIFSELLDVAQDSSNPSVGRELGSLRKLFEFSERLMTLQSLDELLEALLDGVIEVTSARRGALLLIDPADGEEAPLRVRAARNVKREAIEGEDGISDSIVRHVVEKKLPLIVSDAMNDTFFGTSDSVVALKLSSVMCAPLLNQGEVMGALYVGNDEIAHLFGRRQLEILTVFAAQASLLVQNAMLLSALRADKEKLSAELKDQRLGEIIGACPSMLEVFRKLQKVAGTDINVLITGETGTGKELIARELHRLSNRVDGPFITVNCGAIPENLMESEMFGHVKGAFTGAVASRPGRFQQANHGTLFLDEVGELTPALQVKLLRAIQERVVFRVGDGRPEKLDIRIVAATNRELETMIKTGEFREDLYYRLNVVNLWLPPLRERGEDVLIIAKALLAKHADEANSSARGFSPAALAAIRKHDWPGNIRQLENRIKKALVLCDDHMIGPDDLDLGADHQPAIVPLEKAKEDFQRRYVFEVLERNNGNRTQTARDLGVDPRTVFRYLEREQNPALAVGAGGHAGSGSGGPATSGHASGSHGPAIHGSGSHASGNPVHPGGAGSGGASSGGSGGHDN
jgi:transcriptional regulator with GAF, ATPase, and Fis domain